MFSTIFFARPVTWLGLGTVLLLALAAPVLAQSERIGSRGGQTPTLPSPTMPTLPQNLNLLPNAASSLLSGLNASGTALRPGMGWLVSDLTHQGIHGRELADIIHQLKPYKQRGVLTFPQNQQGAAFPTDPTRGQRPTFLPVEDKGHGHGKGIMPGGGGRGVGKGKR